jgi:hypothetical protein
MAHDRFPNPDEDYRRNPDAYRIGRGEAGVLTVEPYKSELLPLWRFKTLEQAQASADALYAKFVAYRDEGDFVGMDMARKFLQMGYTRSRRYARHRSGRKFSPAGDALPDAPDAEKQACADVFKAMWDAVRADDTYQCLKRIHQQRVASSRTKPRL